MRTKPTHDHTTCKPRLSLEQKVRLLARRFRAAERRRRERVPAGIRACRRERASSRPGKTAHHVEHFENLTGASSCGHGCLPLRALKHHASGSASPTGGDPQVANLRSSRLKICAALMTLALFASAILSFAATAVTSTPTFEQANTAFASGNYHAAITQYEALLAHDGFSAPVLFNLGNAFYRAGRFGAAILNYERALVLTPHDSNIAANLRLAREKAGVTAPALGGMARAARLVSPNTLAWLGSLALAAICLTILVRRFQPQFSPAKLIVGIAVVTLLAVATIFAVRWPEFHRAIVVATKAPARIAPANTAAESFALKAGEPVTAVETYGQFILVRTLDGRSGWVSEKEVGMVFKAKPIGGHAA